MDLEESSADQSSVSQDMDQDQLEPPTDDFANSDGFEYPSVMSPPSALESIPEDEQEQQEEGEALSSPCLEEMLDKLEVRAPHPLPAFDMSSFYLALPPRLLQL